MRGAAQHAVSRLRDVRDAIELAMRPPGERIVIKRHAAEAILNDIGIVACLIRSMAERGRE